MKGNEDDDEGGHDALYEQICDKLDILEVKMDKTKKNFKRLDELVSNLSINFYIVAH